VTVVDEVAPHPKRYRAAGVVRTVLAALWVVWAASAWWAAFERPRSAAEPAVLRRSGWLGFGVLIWLGLVVTVAVTMAGSLIP
jgi:hypothetical protein